MQMGRPRERNKDLPPFMHRKPDGRFFYLGPPFVDGNRTYHGLNERDRAKAIDEYWTYRKANDTAEAGTFGEIIDAYMTHPQGLKRVKSAVTRAGYERLTVDVRERWGDRRYALTADQALKNPKFLRVSTFDDFLREFEDRKGSVIANRKVKLVSAMFSFAIRRDMTNFNPTLGVAYNTEIPRRVTPDRDALARVIAAAAKPAMRLMIELASVTSIDQGVIRLMTRTQVGELLDLGRSKTGVEQEWTITPFVRSIFERAEKLPGRHKSLYVFPRPNGQPYTSEQFQGEWLYARGKVEGATFQFRDIRKWNIQQAEKDGQNAQSFAAHKRRSTTDQHYLNNKKRATPLK